MTTRRLVWLVTAAVKKAGVKLYYVGCGVEDKLAYTGSEKWSRSSRKST
jgi:hypothetical protein